MANLKKLSDDTHIIHSLIKRDIETMTGEKKDVFQFLLNISSVKKKGLVTLYSIKEIRKNLIKYRAKGLYPIKKTGVKKYDLFLLIANRMWGVVVCRILSLVRHR